MLSHHGFVCGGAVPRVGHNIGARLATRRAQSKAVVPLSAVVGRFVIFVVF